MKYKFVGIVVFMMMATTVVSAINVNIGDTQTATDGEILPNIPGLNWGVDQKQTYCDGYGMELAPPILFAQRFTPSKDKLTAVSMFIFKYGNPPAHVIITVSIRESLNGSDLVTMTRDTTTDPISATSLWILFDFEDISVTPGSPYIIVVSANASIVNNTYCWAFSSITDRYTGGEAWMKENESTNWTTEIFGSDIKDFCFKTYYKKPLDIFLPKDNENLILSRIVSILEQFPNAFPILHHLLGY